MSSILNKLKKTNRQVKLTSSNSANIITDGVFYATLHRLGEAIENWQDEPVEERAMILNYLESKHATQCSPNI